MPWQSNEPIIKEYPTEFPCVICETKLTRVFTELYEQGWKPEPRFVQSYRCSNCNHVEHNPCISNRPDQEWTLKYDKPRDESI
jgi:hypothetical protein